ncbi:hypothetical protein [Enterococcus sp. C76]|uniref:hypothetical protein n=1 Tax=Enterococcus sp. C76 TaxID=3231334 RepID=UPI0034A05302
MDRIMFEERDIIKNLEVFELMYEKEQYCLQRRICCIIEKCEKQFVIARHLKCCISECLCQKIDSKSRSLFFYWEEKRSDFMTEYHTFLLVKDDTKKLENGIEDGKEVLKEEVRKFLYEKGYEIDSSFEGDFVTWIGVYARPKGKFTYLDSVDEEANLYVKQDFGDWFEWKIQNGYLVEW